MSRARLFARSVARIAFATLASGGFANAAPELDVRAALRFEAPHVEGTAEVAWRNDGDASHRTLRFLLFANRFRTPPAWSDLSRHFLLATPAWQAGSTEVLSVVESGTPLSFRFEPAGDVPDVVLAVDLGRDVAPGDVARIAIAYRTTLPPLFDVFGATPGLLVADAGWYPQPLSPTPSDAAPPAPLRADVRARLSVPEGAALVVGRDHFATGGAVEVSTAGASVPLVLSAEPFEIARQRMAGRLVSVYSVPSREVEHRVSHNAPPVEALLDTLAVVRRESAPSDLAVVRLPLRWLPSQSRPGSVWLSDRLFEVHPVLRPMHQREVAYAVFLADELARAEAEARESPGDAAWVAEGLAWRGAEELYANRLRSGREVRDWIRLFDFFAVVDRFETAPRIPLLRAFFPTLASDDPVGIRIETFLQDRPPGRMVFERLEARLRPGRFEELIESYRRGNQPFREVVRREAGDATADLLVRWLAPYRDINFSLEDVERNPGDVPGARFSIAREGPALPETIDVELETDEGSERIFVDVDRSPTEVTTPARSPVRAVTLDPDRHLVETRLDDNRSPGEFQLLLDSADVAVSSTEFGFSTLVVGRRRYDYRKDLGVAGFVTNRSYGAHTGFQLHFGPPIDRNLFSRNLFLYHSFQRLDTSFRDRSTDRRGPSGNLAGFGFRYNGYDAFWFENPSGARHLRLFFDAYDRGLGSDFDYVQGGATLAATFPLRADTILAGQVVNGFSAPTREGEIPIQGLFSLGGFRSIRGIGAEEELARNLFVVRAEIRHLLPWRLDLNLEDALIARRLQVKAFVDAGRVGDSAKIYDPSGFAVGIGGGVNLFYDFFGFFPTSFYLDAATRADESASVQVLFGARQAY